MRVREETVKQEIIDRRDIERSGRREGEKRQEWEERVR